MQRYLRKEIGLDRKEKMDCTNRIDVPSRRGLGKFAEVFEVGMMS